MIWKQRDAKKKKKKRTKEKIFHKVTSTWTLRDSFWKNSTCYCLLCFQYNISRFCIIQECIQLWSHGVVQRYENVDTTLANLLPLSGHQFPHLCGERFRSPQFLHTVFYETLVIHKTWTSYTQEKFYDWVSLGKAAYRSTLLSINSAYNTLKHCFPAFVTWLHT